MLCIITFIMEYKVNLLYYDVAPVPECYVVTVQHILT